MNRAFISLGSNVNKEHNLPAAISLLGGMCRLVAVSTVFETVPVGLKEQPNFFNAAVLLETSLTAQGLKKNVLAEVERRLKRMRQADRNAPRTIDADLALFNDDVLVYDGHTVPDPDIVRFAHVAVPIADIAPDLAHPLTGEPMAALAARLMAEATAANGGRPPLWPRPDILLP